ncbi:Vegetative incompatibility HET-E-1-like protein [Cladobotryum mycophilum]|uniref:Mitochondrial division protein 1 n=1 Tax=Cladobotryum mycophilum TaxID=491253 RepID=A0ABR0T0S1_9HYPO
MSLSFSPDGGWLASASGDKTFKVWDVTIPFSGNIETHSNIVKSVQIAMDGERFLTLAYSLGEYKVWDSFKGDVILHATGDSPISMAAISPNSKVLVTISWATITFWDLNIGGRLLKPFPYIDRIVAVAFSANGEWLVLRFELGTIFISNRDKDKLFKKFPSQPQKASDAVRWLPIAISSDGHHVASVLDDIVVLENLSTKKQLRPYQERCIGLNFSTNDQLLASICHAWAGSIWEVASGACVRRFNYEPGLASWQLNPTFVDFNIAMGANPDVECPREDCLIRYHISHDGVWIMRHKEKLLWLPPEYRVSSAAASGQYIVIGCKSGDLICIGMGDE